ncbi:hypothetical protein OKA05_13735 [Luteolibacter arcticus]|uniref:Uncharacterized protein n=1 Tax=Luteolibacter arcticus TaxID=1581411 RepID=A0ABT3GJG4_9BACT|nr:hypothetical protein [Luteolibacter arcticus]MCW1923621.1 hypothetical protein [Luteolibacter arcticus]
MLGIDERRLEGLVGSPDSAMVGEHLDPDGYIENILKLLPDTKHIHLVMGTSPLRSFGTRQKAVTDWIATAKNPKTGKLFTEMVYQPMLELLAYLRANGFKTYNVSGGGIEFMRPWAEKTYGIPPRS